MGTRHVFGNSVRDYVVLATLLGLANYFLSAADPGWFQWNPTPWLLPALLLGARYGFTSGLTAGLATTGLIVLAQRYLLAADPPLLVKERGYFFFALVAAGAVSGELRDILRSRSVSLAARKNMLEDENDRLKSQLEITRQARHELQRQLALYNAPLAALDDELKDLFANPTEEFPKALLATLHRLTQITSAGIYLVKGPLLEQCASLHPTPPLQPLLKLEETPLAAQALDSGLLASVPDALALTASQPFLAALPWRFSQGPHAVLLIQDMPLEAFTLHNLATVELILGWTKHISRLRDGFRPGSASSRTVNQQAFTEALDSALQAERIHALPSAVLRLSADGADQVRAILAQLPPTALATLLEKAHALAVLLPFSGDIEAIRLTRQLTASFPTLRAHHYLIVEPATMEVLWKELQQ